MTKLLSVAIPCYNSQDYIRRAVDSLLPVKDQIEILIINDGSTDDTARIAEEYASEYPDTVRLINKENGGHGDAVMTGINEACGLYFRVLDSDDWVERDALISLIKVLDTMAQSDSPVDLVIRPSGEQRLSNFMIWQCAYAEFYYSDILWPDFNNAEFDKAIKAYSDRNRRFGGV